MAITPGEGGTGGLGGTASSICAISPSDLIGTIGNLITRIENLEFQLSQVVGANLHTESLDNISEQVGWVYGVEFMGTTGWIMTPAGTLIPPPGFTILGSGLTLSDGNTYSAVLMDSDGVLQYGFTTDGQIAGAQAGGGSMDYYVAAPTGHETGSRGITKTAETQTITVPPHVRFASYTFVVSKDGVYSVSASCMFECNIGVGDTGTMEGQIEIRINPSDPGTAFTDVSKAIASNEFYNEMAIASGAISNLYVLSASDTVRIEFSMAMKNGTLNNRSIDDVRIGLARISTT